LLNPANFAVPIPRNLLDGYAQTGSSRFSMESYAAFGEIDHRLTDRLTLTLGLRYTHEDKRGDFATTVQGGPALSGLPAATVAELTRARLSIFRPQSYSVADSRGNASGRANLAWTPRADLLAYLSYTDGFKSGGLNMSGLPLDAVNRPALATAVIDDERNRTIEAGLKRRFSGGRATLNVAAYRTAVTNYQANIVSSLETAALRSYPSNIPEVRVQGFEIDAALRLGDRWNVTASVAHADGENTDYPDGPCPLERQTAATVACNLTGARLAGLSRWVGAISADYRRPLAGGEIIVHVDANRRTGYYADTSASRFTWIDAHTLVNANIGYAWPNGWEFVAWGRNVFDARFLTALTIQAGNSGLILGQPGDPRQFGGTLRFRF
jgi:iron complex outermembrane receptor protein